jgi:MoaA/NifB/PqqE/SkfB family radical SAM enzyme/alpha-beta hydrolase superfamily lysophospholipase
MPGFVLVHGYTGSPRDLAPLADRLAARFGRQAVRNVCLPGHGPGHAKDAPPPFDEAAFIQSIAAAAEAMARREGRIVLVGHSTGGTLALASITQGVIQPALLVLMAAPHHVDGAALVRWERHRAGRPAIALGDVARMVGHINQMGSLPALPNMPALLIQGDQDPLVPPKDGVAWGRHGFEPVRRLTVPQADHDLFNGPSGPAMADWIVRQTDDLLHSGDAAAEAAAERLAALEGPRLQRFFQANPLSRRHLVRSPAAQQALDAPATPLSDTAPDPIQLNIEATTCCNLECPHCARTRQDRPARQMDPALFAYLIDLLPNAWRVVLAGLGEPTMHSRLPELVAAAADRGRQVNLVTNGTLLSADLCRGLVAAGLGAVTFSLDAADPAVAAETRPGGRMDRILENIRACAQLAAENGMATAVFTAVSTRNVAHLPQLAATVAGLGVQAWMLSDLNFHWNQSHSVHHTLDAAGRGAIRQALRTAFARQLPVLGLQGLEAFALAQHYRKYLLYPPERLAARSPIRTHCVSPWQTLPVDVAGHVSVCDCTPDHVVGNLCDMPFCEIWNGPRMRAWRRQMLSATPPEACRACPRF